MNLTFSELDGMEHFLLLCAVLGGGVVLFRLFAQFFGTDAHHGGVDHTSLDGYHTNSDDAFEFLSIHGLSSFLMMFGLVGLALYRQSKAGLIVSIVGASLAGLASVWIIGKLFQSASKMQVSGTLNIEDAVGSNGTVYLTIPLNGIGRVSIDFKNHLREFDARETTGQMLATGLPIRVVRVSGSVLVVEKLT